MYLLQGITGSHMLTVPRVTSPGQTLGQTAPYSVHTSSGGRWSRKLQMIQSDLKLDQCVSLLWRWARSFFFFQYLIYMIHIWLYQLSTSFIFLSQGIQAVLKLAKSRLNLISFWKVKSEMVTCAASLSRLFFSPFACSDNLTYSLSGEPWPFWFRTYGAGILAFAVFLWWKCFLLCVITCTQVQLFMGEVITPITAFASMCNPPSRVSLPYKQVHLFRFTFDIMTLNAYSLRPFPFPRAPSNFSTNSWASLFEKRSTSVSSSQ